MTTNLQTLEQFQIFDTTLRDGEHSPAAALNKLVVKREKQVAEAVAVAQ